eukprot:CAMPEP_0177639492 /NCGR_PEP_ID=MMETSP0447-20121125/6048_1 /TAXON_ID=0 /ORGANISM="Stygamoeba regulata, Strain BSH-02190019" /LENGTH=347 /DNA_ID=CAMNT_0019141519 /DNA_START=42 /DNA_END=1085 /DNA_ORIENTATION=-
MDLFSLSSLSYMLLFLVGLVALGALILTKPDILLRVLYLLFTSRLGRAWVRRERRAPESAHTPNCLPIALPNGVTVLPLAVLSDNYSYLVWNQSKEAIAFDVSDPAPVQRAVNEHGLRMIALFSTHHHWDHCAGNEELVALFPHIQVIVPRGTTIPSATRFFADGDSIQVADMKVTAIHTPCHTMTHMCFFVTLPGELSAKNPPLLMSGDCLFVAGTGKFFEGTARDMLPQLQKLRQLPAETRLFSGHEYACRNLKWAAKLLPGNKSIQDAFARAQVAENEGRPFFTSIGEELEINPFLRWDCAEVQVATCFVDAELIVRELRRLKNGIRPTALYDQRLGRAPTTQL